MKSFAGGAAGITAVLRSQERNTMAKEAACSPSRAQEHFVGRRPRQFVVQQHDDHHHRRTGQHHCLVLCWHQGFQGFAQVDPLCRPGCCRRCCQEGAGTRHEARWKSKFAAPVRVVNRRFALCRLPASPITSIRDVTPIPHNGCRPRKRAASDLDSSGRPRLLGLAAAD